MKKVLAPVLASSLASSPPEYAPLPIKVKLAYGIGHVLNDLCASMWFTYLLVYFHLVLEFSNSLSGVILLIGQVADGLSTPFVGFESDKSDGFWLFKYGKRKTWHLIGTVCVIGSFPFLFNKCIGCETSHDWARLVYYSAFVIIFQFGWASVQVSHLSLIPDLTDDTHDRTELNAIRYAFTVISNICVYVTTWVCLGVDSNSQTVGPGDASKFQQIVFIVVAIGTVFSIIFHVGVKEPKQELSHSFSAHFSTISEKSRMIWKDWFKEFQFYQVAILYMCTRLFVNLSQVYIPLFLQDTLKLNESSIAIIPLVMFVSGFLSSFFMKCVTRRVGKKFTYMVGGLIGIAACIWIFFGEGDSFRYVHLYVVAVLLGIGGSTMLVTSLAITNDLIGGNTESSAFVFGAMSFTDKFSNGIAVLLIQYFHPCSSCCEACALYYHYVLAGGCGSAAILALFALATLAPYEIGNRKKDLIIEVGPEDLDQSSPLLNSINSTSSYTKEKENQNGVVHT